jgi:dTDP-4-amino-4,6-dideoxygalactose transaminase
MKKERIPFMQPSLPSLEDYYEEIKTIWQSRRLTSKGSKHQSLEATLKDYLNVPFASLFVNGHLALEAILEAFELKGEIITTAFTFSSTAHAIVRSGCTPVFCDIKEDDFTLDETQIESLINENTVAIMPVHVLGNVCNVKAIEAIGLKYNLKVIYDAAHVFGVKMDGIGIGNYGDASMFSMNATKVYNSIEGGLLSFKDQSLNPKLELIKYYGIVQEDEIVYPGSNLKMNEFQAAMGLVNLPHLKDEIAKRRILVEQYQQSLSQINGVRTVVYRSDVAYNFSYYSIIVEEGKQQRDALHKYLLDHEVETKKYFYPIVTEYACYKASNNYDLPISHHIADRVLVLPIYGLLELSDVNRVIQHIQAFFEQ